MCRDGIDACCCVLLQLWWDTAPASLRATLWMLLADLPPDLPILLFATADAPISDLDQVNSPWSLHSHGDHMR